MNYDEALRRKAISVLYEIRMMYLASLLRAPDSFPPRVVKALLTEAFVVHWRCLAAFFGNKTVDRAKKTDALLSDFVPESSFGQLGPLIVPRMSEEDPPDFPFNRANRRISHITEYREQGAEANRWSTLKMAHSFLERCEAFLEVVQHLDIDTELNKTRRVIATFKQLACENDGSLREEALKEDRIRTSEASALWNSDTVSDEP